MKDETKKIEIRNAILLGGLMAVAYLSVYVARNLLGAVTPKMIQDGAFTKEQIGLLSSAFFVTYAVGQLFNGWIGDRVKAKYMICLGLLLAGVAHLLVPVLAKTWVLAFVSYALAGLFLSMIYAPMTKIVSDSMPLVYATRSMIGFTFSSFLGSPAAGLLAAWLTWQGTFFAGSSIMMAMSVICFLSISVMEKKHIVRYPEKDEKPKLKGSLKVLLNHQIVKFTLVSILTGVVRTTVVFWLPTYISERLNFSPETAAIIFTVSSLVISFSTFIGISLYELLKRDRDKTLLIAFSASALLFTATFFVKEPIPNIICLVLSILSANCASTILWSVYCPGLRDTGMVSTATGFLDFASYMAASVSSSIFANAVAVIGWEGLVLVWVGLMIIGVFVSLPYNRIFRKKEV